MVASFVRPSPLLPFSSTFWQLVNEAKEEQENALSADMEHRCPCPSGAPQHPSQVRARAGRAGGRALQNHPAPLLDPTIPLVFPQAPHPFCRPTLLSPTPALLPTPLNIHTCTPFPPLECTSPVSPPGRSSLTAPSARGVGGGDCREPVDQKAGSMSRLHQGSGFKRSQNPA